MSWDEDLRSNAFWFIDRLKGRGVYNHLAEMEQAFKDPLSFEKINQQRLENLLTHACSTTKFYNQFSGFNSIHDFPVITKNELKANYDNLFSSLYNKNDLVTRTTSGSYGIPFTYYMTREKYNKRVAELLFFNGWAGYKLGMRYGHIRPQYLPKKQRFFNNTLYIDPSRIDEQWLETQRNNLKNPRVKFLVCYPINLSYIVQYCESKGDTPDMFHLKGVICSAEKLTLSVKERAQRILGCTVLDRYSSQELGVIAHQNRDQESYSVNFTSHFIEILKFDKDEPVEPGESGRIVATDMFSYAMPLVRFEVGDSAQLYEKTDTPIMQIKAINGRIVEAVYTPKGESVNHSALYGVIDKDETLPDKIFQYQFIQETRDGYRIKLQPKPNYNKETEAHLLQRYKNLFGKEANFTIEYVDSIPPMRSGKRSIFINNYNKGNLERDGEVLPFLEK